ncbi:MAG: hypothetical protein U0835_02475 [Isosphaeraceae bacterium]
MLRLPVGGDLRVGLEGLGPQPRGQCESFGVVRPLGQPQAFGVVLRGLALQDGRQPIVQHLQPRVGRGQFDQPALGLGQQRGVVQALRGFS